MVIIRDLTDSKYAQSGT